MKTELVEVETEDSIILHGAFYEAEQEKPAVIIMHGAAMNFYTGLGRFLPEILSGHGFSCLSANNRGHDFGTAPDHDRKPVIGLMRDIFKDCVKDVQALLNFLRSRGYPRVILLGHSQAIPKLLYAQNQLQFAEVQGMILVSPPPSVSKMMRYLTTDNYYERGLFKANELGEMGMYDQLIVLRGRGTMPWIFMVSTFLDFYGPNTPADTEELVKEIYCPMLLIRGSKDFPPVSMELMQNMKQNAAVPESVTIREINEASHFYSGQEKQLGNIILEWLDSY